ncbi:MAG: YceI family protein [Pseudomonadota bacterium]
MRTFAAILTLLLTTAAGADPVAYRLNTAESRVGFTWFFGENPIRGRMPVESADIYLDFASVSRSSVDVSLDVASAEAGFPFASDALKAPNVLWAERFPLIEFESTEVSQRGTGATLRGSLTIRGVTRPITLNATVFRRQGAALGERENLAVRMTGALSRAAFGADGWPNEVGDRVELDILAVIDRAE